jgi:hypothetical protein
MLTLAARCVFFVLCAVLSQAQEFRATLTGRVIDPSGATIANAPVQARNIGTNEVSASLTDSQGTYSIPFLRPGNYTLSVEAPGFKKSVREGLILSVGQTLGINVTVDVGQLTEQVVVSAEASLLQTEKSDRGQVIDEQRVHELPLNARNPFMLSILSAGVNFNGNIIYQRPFDNGAIADWTISGGLDRQNEFLLDGAPNNAQAGGNNIALVPPVDSVQEFKIQTNSYDSQYGKSSGGSVNVLLKGGTNRLHGTAYEFARRNAWDANSFQNNAAGIPKVAHFLDQYGGSIGGPIFFPKLYNGKDKSFFFVNYEGYREGTPTPLVLSVPEPEFLQGDFSKLVDNQGRPIVIYDPSTGHDVNGTWVRSPFDGNKIPPSRLNPIAQKILSFYPKPNQPFAGSFYSQGNLFVPGGDNLDHDSFYNLVIKLDQNVSEKHHVFFRHASNDRTEIRSFNALGPNQPGGDGQFPLKRVNDAYVLDWVGSLRPTFLANARISFGRYIEGSAAYGNSNYSPTQLGFPAGMVNQLALPGWFGRYEFDNYQALGKYYSFNYTNTLAFHPTITWIKSAHAIKTGVDMRWIQYNILNPGNPFRFQSTREFTQKEYNRGDALSGNSIASFLLGDPTPSNGNSGAEVNVLPSTLGSYFAPYIQDDWKISRRLTLNLGIRWDLNVPPSERYNRISRGFDPTAPSPADKLVDHSAFPSLPPLIGGLLFAGHGGTPTIVANTDKTAIQPRLGMAYRITEKFVFRGGFGKFYLNPNNDYIQNNGFSVTTPFVGSTDGGRTPIENALNNPYPSSIVQPAGSALGAATFLGRSGFSFFDPTFKLPYVWQFSSGFQYELSAHSALEIAYAGNRGYKLETNLDYNEPSLAFRQQCNPLEGGNPAFCDGLVPNPFYNLAAFAGTTLGTSPTISRFNLARPFPQFGSFTQRGRNDGKSWFNSMQVTYELRRWAGLNLNVAYTLSKMIEQGRNFTDNSGNLPFLDVQRFVVQRGIYQYDRPHVIKVSSVWELPFGKGRKLFNTSNAFWSRVASGWQHTIIFQYSSGRPWDLPGNTTSTAPVRILHNPGTTPDWSASKIYGVVPCVARYNSDNTITLQPYSQNVQGCSATTADFLELPRYAPREVPFRDGRVRLHSTPQVDMSIAKNTQIKETMSVQFRAEAFNLMNTFYFPLQQFNNNPDDSNFGSIIKGTVAQGNANFPRQIQLAVKFLF